MADPIYNESIPVYVREAEHLEVVAERDRYAALLGEALDYLDHQSWRCAHPPHYYYADGPPINDCACGLDSFQRRLQPVITALDERREESS